jgi:hypothetical protein
MIPKMERGVFIDAAQSCNEVIFERADSTFSCIASMHAWGHKLIVNFIFDKELFESSGAFVVELLELGAEPGSNKPCMQYFVPGQDAWAGATAEGFDKYAITVKVVEDKDVIVAAVGSDNELASLVGVDLASGRWFNKSGKTVMGASNGRVAGWE